MQDKKFICIHFNLFTTLVVKMNSTCNFPLVTIIKSGLSHGTDRIYNMASSFVVQGRIRKD